LIVELLVAHEANLNAQNDHGRTPLYEAADIGYKDVVEVLLANNAEVNAKDSTGRTPLRMATLGDRKSVAKYMAVAELLRQHGGQE
jgi:ankyrin repeat protein